MANAGNIYDQLCAAGVWKPRARKPVATEPSGMPPQSGNESRTEDGDPLRNHQPPDPEFHGGEIIAGTGGGRVKMSADKAPRMQDMGNGVVRDTSLYPGMEDYEVDLGKDSISYKSTFDPAFKRNYPATAATNSYKGPFDPNQANAYRLGKGIKSFFEPEGIGGRVLDAGPGLAAPVGALTMGIPAWLVGKWMDWQSGNPESNMSTKAGIIAALLGAMSSAWMSGQRKKAHEKRAFMNSSFDARARLMAAVNNDPTLGMTARQLLIEQILALSPARAGTVFNMLPGLLGAGAGATIARLLGFGGIGVGMGALAGGLAGGLRSNVERDSFGNAIQRLPWR